MIDLHTKRAENRQESDLWVRKQALSVLIYEGIVANIFDYDYAPQSALIESKRIWINISQEGQSDVEYLREEELICSLQLTSKSHKPIICYQVSDKGTELLRFVSRREKEAVHEFAYMSGSRELLKATWDGSNYWLQAPSGIKKTSTITEIEDVSYVSSAYIPQCLRYGGRPTLSNAHRAHESGEFAKNNIRDQDLDEIITLNSVSIIVAEYVPFGSNQIVQLNNNVGSTERVQGGYISPIMDNNSSGTDLELTSELTSVEILDYTLTNHINFEAEIRFAEDTGVVQVETFGMSLNAEGTCFYGMQIEAVMDRIKDNISLDHLSRILVDVQQDSSVIVDSVLSPYQRELLNLVFQGDASNRNKVNLIIANEITPNLTAEEYMDKGEYENEFQQVIGDTKAAYDISEHDTLIFGANGLIVCGPNSRLHEPLLCAYLQFTTMDIFLQNFFSRVRILHDDLEKENTSINTIESNPTALKCIQGRICKISRELILLEEILGYLLEGLELMEIPPEPPEQAGRSLYERLEISGMREQLVRRTTDIKKNVISGQRYLNVLKERITVSSEGKMVLLCEALEQNTKKLCALQVTNSDTVHSLQILQIVFSGMIAFEILDRITGDWTVLDTYWMKGFVEDVIQDNILLWFSISIIVWVIIGIVVHRVFTVMNWRSRGVTTIWVKVNRKISIDKLRDMMREKSKSNEERHYEGEKNIVKVTYDEDDAKSWGGASPNVTLEYDDKNKFLYNIMLQYNRRKADKSLVFNGEELKQKVMRDLDCAAIFIEKDHVGDSINDSEKNSK